VLNSSNVSRRRRSFVAGAFVLGLVPLGCASTSARLARTSGHPTYQIECANVGDCWTQARRACGGDYRTLARYDNWIPESDLPGYNHRTIESSEPHRVYGARMPYYGPGIESDEPLPITDVVVACNGF